MAASDNRPPVQARKTYKLRDFTERFQLPRHVKVVSGRDLKMVRRKTGMKRGDYLYLQMLAIDKVTLTYTDHESNEGLRNVKLPAKSPLKFKILPPINVSTASMEENEKGKIYPTVGDLIDILPTVFQANIGYDDPYLPTIFKKGEVFRLRRRIRSVNDGQTLLECEDAEGNVIQLPKSCRGDFTILEDERTYTLQDIVSFGTISRKLKLSNENMKLMALTNGQDIDTNEAVIEASTEEPIYGNITKPERKSSVPGFADLPLSFKGIITLNKPNMFLVASPRDQLDVRWKVELDLDLDVMVSSDVEQEEAPTKEYDLREFVSEFESEFPLTACVVSYRSIPNKFRKYINTGMDVLVHRVDTDTKLLASTEDEFYCIHRNVRGRFRKTLKRFETVSDLIGMKGEIRVKVLEDIASDVPEFFSLNMGDVIVFKNPSIQKMKIKYGKKSYVEYKYIICEKTMEDGSVRTVKLLHDLDLKFIEIPPPGKELGFTAGDIFSGTQPLPVRVDFLPVEDGCTCIRYDTEIQLEYLVSDNYAVVSTLPSRQNRRISGLEAKVDHCLKIPLRDSVKLKLKERLHFPTSYFRLPSTDKWISVDTERINREVYDDMTKYNDQAYEDCQPQGGQLLHSASADCLSLAVAANGGKDEKKYNILRRKGRSLSWLPQSKKQSKTLEQQTQYKSESGLSIAGSTISTDHDTDYGNEDSIYELYEPPRRTSFIRRLSGKKYTKKAHRSASTAHNPTYNKPA